MTKTTNTTYLTVGASSSTTSTTDLDWKKYGKCHPYKGKYNPRPCFGWNKYRSFRVCIPSNDGHNCYQSPDGSITCNPSDHTIENINFVRIPNCNFTGKADHYIGTPRRDWEYTPLWFSSQW